MMPTRRRIISTVALYRIELSAKRAISRSRSTPFPSTLFRISGRSTTASSPLYSALPSRGVGYPSSGSQRGHFDCCESFSRPRTPGLWADSSVYPGWPGSTTTFPAGGTEGPELLMALLVVSVISDMLHRLRSLDSTPESFHWIGPIQERLRPLGDTPEFDSSESGY